MKLFCSSKLLKKLRRKCEKVPTPEDLLDRWYVNLIDLHGYNLLAAILPDFRFCALVWNVPVDPSTDLTQLLVPAIREALHDPYYGIPQSVIDAYMPQDTVLELCTTGDSALINGMGAATKDIQSWSDINYTYAYGLKTLKAQRKVNSFLTVKRMDDHIFTRWQAVKELLQQRYGRGVPAMELEVSLDLQQYTAKRTLIVSEDITFDILNDYLKAAYHLEDEDTHQFILPPAGNRNAPLHIFWSLGEQGCESQENSASQGGKTPISPSSFRRETVFGMSTPHTTPKASGRWTSG